MRKALALVLALFVLASASCNMSRSSNSDSIHNGNTDSINTAEDMDMGMETYSISDDKKTLSIGENSISFNDEIETILEYPTAWIVHLENAHYINGRRAIDASKQPLNNVYAVDNGCNVIWNIKQILSSHLGTMTDEYYTGLIKLSDTVLRVMTFRCITFDIDINTLEVVDKICTK